MKRLTYPIVINTAAMFIHQTLSYLRCARHIATAPASRRRADSAHPTQHSVAVDTHAPCQTKRLPLTRFANGTRGKQEASVATPLFLPGRKSGVASRQKPSMTPPPVRKRPALAAREITYRWSSADSLIREVNHNFLAFTARHQRIGISLPVPALKRWVMALRGHSFQSVKSWAHFSIWNRLVTQSQ